MQVLPPSENEGRVIILTEPEKVIVEWFHTLLDAGHNPGEAVRAIEDRVPHHGITYKTLQNPDFRAYLLD